MAIYQSIHSGEYIDEQISAVSTKLPLTGGTVDGTITATQFIGPLEGTATNAILANNATHAVSADEAINTMNSTNVQVSTSTSKAYVLGVTSAASGYQSPIFNSEIYIENSVLMGAAWNDYAEYRRQFEDLKPGYCVSSKKDGSVFQTTERLQYCEGIVSDTFGFAIGQSISCNVPLAVCGRVLAYYNGEKDDYNIGDPVCAGPAGKICKMTRDEVREWPDRMIGTVSEIPEYETWGANNILVDNRIWIKVK